jgi:glycosyltransferase involved in cell wall biosynthesis
MHIVLVGDYPQQPDRIRGGVEAVVTYLSQALQRDPELQVSVVTLDKGAEVYHTAQHGDIDIHYLPASTLPSRLSQRANIRSLRDQLRALQPDLVHAHGTTAYAFAAAASGFPWVLTVHGIRHRELALRPGLLNRYRTWLIERDERTIIRRAPTVIAISPHVQNVFGAQMAQQVHTIDNPIADSFFQVPDRRQAGRILFVGHLTPLKDLMTLLRAFAQVHAQMPEARLYFLELRHFVVESGLDRAVTFLGRLDDQALVEEYAQCSVLALSSMVEVAPMVVMQAMAAGRPVVSTNAGGARYLVSHGETGWIVPVQDHQALGDGLLRLLGDAELAHSMGKRGREVAQQRFRAAAVATKTKQVYRLAAAHAPSSGMATVELRL